MGCNCLKQASLPTYTAITICYLQYIKGIPNLNEIVETFMFILCKFETYLSVIQSQGEGLT